MCAHEGAHCRMRIEANIGMPVVGACGVSDAG